MTAPPDAPVQEVAEVMQDEGVGSVVVEDDGKPVGIITDRDVMLRIVAEGDDPGIQRAGDVMTEDPCCLDESAGVFELTEAMADNGVRRIPVVEGDRLTGIVTLDDVSRVFSDEQQNLARVVEAESPPY